MLKLPLSKSPLEPNLALASKDISEPKVYIETFGCQMNILDSELVQNQLTDLGYLAVKNPEDANIVLFNTCSVRDLSEQKVLSRLGIIKQRKDNGENVIVGVLGCMAERTNTDILKKHPFIDLLAGPSKLHQVPHLLQNLRAEQQTNPLFSTSTTQVALSNFRTRKGKSSEVSKMDDLEILDASRLSATEFRSKQAYIRITRGCNKFCSFCVVPRTRGPEVHRSPNAIVDEAKRLVDSGVMEITLLGQTINHYNFINENQETNFANLLYRIHEEVPQLQRLRFLTSHPRDFSDEALDVMASSKRICKYLHIPAQSGSDDVLRRMNRGYTTEIYMNLIERARKRMPNISILGDMIVGFPGESDADFEASLELLRKVRYKNIFVFKYSPRPDTIAYKKELEQIPVPVKRERNRRMLEVQHEISLAHHEEMIGQNLSVLVEGVAKINPNADSDLITILKPVTRLTSRTEGDHIVSFSGPKSLIGQMVEVKITRATSLSLTGELVS
ncbi:MAG: tRNA (N6-isopentenyl adenosine(37)-C2)-methylthiotransferase MiaB [bacterium]|nr:tRNA (N6-isopentenyl adenosine(37)-C2)-methylthiotransferase MiaB [bacterium]